ncbi:MAG: immunoglobulin domain-containing protein, partial [bacterium]
MSRICAPSRHAVFAALLLAHAAHAQPASQPRFELLDTSPNSTGISLSSGAEGISGDGSLVYGFSVGELIDPLRPEAGSQISTFAWRNGFPVQLTRFSRLSNFPQGVSRNGLFIGGRKPDGSFSAIFWPLGAPETALPGPDPSDPFAGIIPFTSDAVGLSDDGRRVIGSLPFGFDSRDGAFAWSADTGFTPSPPIAGFRAGPLQGPGLLVVGAANDARIALGYEAKFFIDEQNRVVNDTQAFYWTAASGTVGLGWAALNPFSNNSIATDATPDGAVICGTSSTADTVSNVGHLWTAQTGWERIAPDNFPSPALAIAADGRTVVGWYSPSSGQSARAYIWTRDDGFNDLQTVLQAQGAVLPPGFTLSEARGISDDGRTIVGFGIDVQGRSIGWVATYIPQPGCPQVLTQPAPVTIPAGQTAVLEAVFTGRTPQSLRWLRDGQPISAGVGGAAPGGGLVFGQTSARLTILSAQASDAGQYTCEVESTCGTLVTVPVTLQVTAQVNCPEVLEPLRPVFANAGQSVSVSALVVGSGPLIFSWFRNDQPVVDGPGGAASGGGTVSGSATPTLRIDASTAADTGIYSYQAIGPCGILEQGDQAPVLIAASPGCPVTPRAPEILGDPLPGEILTIKIGSLLGNAPFTFQWTRNGQPVVEGVQGASPNGGFVQILGEPDNRLRIIGVQPSDSGVYACTISNACGSITTLPISVTISEPVPACNIADIVGIGGLPPADGLITGDDFNTFIAAFATDSLFADITGVGGPPSDPDGLITGDDFNAFISAFAAGCP